MVVLAVTGAVSPRAPKHPLSLAAARLLQLAPKRSASGVEQRPSLSSHIARSRAREYLAFSRSAERRARDLTSAESKCSRKKDSSRVRCLVRSELYTTLARPQPKNDYRNRQADKRNTLTDWSLSLFGNPCQVGKSGQADTNELTSPSRRLDTARVKGNSNNVNKNAIQAAIFQNLLSNCQSSMSSPIIRRVAQKRTSS